MGTLGVTDRKIFSVLGCDGLYFDLVDTCQGWARLDPSLKCTDRFLVSFGVDLDVSVAQISDPTLDP